MSRFAEDPDPGVELSRLAERSGDPTAVRLSLPRFRMESSFSLKDPLVALGMTTFISCSALAQDVLYELNALLVADRIPHLMVFLDSPMASRITEVFKRHFSVLVEVAVGKGLVDLLTEVRG